MSNIKFIVYTGFGANSEVLITTPEQEASFLEEWFGVSTGRDLEDYDRDEYDETGIQVRLARLRVM